MKILETDRLILRHQVLEDLDNLFALYCQKDIREFIPDAPRNYEETKKELEWHMNGHPENSNLGLWASIHKETNKYIGRCGLLPWTIDGQKEVEVAYLISNEYWGQGLGTEAAQAILAYGFEVLNLPRLICLIDEKNLASVRIAAKLGMIFERVGRDEMGSFLLYSKSKASVPTAS